MYKKIFISFLLFFIPLFFANAARSVSSFEIKLNGNEFKPGDEVKASAVFVNSFNEKITGEIIFSIYSLDGRFPTMPKRLAIAVEPGQKSAVLDYSILVSENMPEGIYLASAKVNDSNGTPVAEELKQLIVSGVKKQIGADLQICKSPDCADNQAVFLQRESVYFNLQTNLTDLQLKGWVENTKTQEKYDLQFENNKSKISLNNAGSYTINLTLNKTGYSGQTIQKDFAVISEPANINSASKCDGNGKCSGSENIQNCPQDCLKKSQIEYYKLILIIVIIIFAAIFLVLLYQFYRKQRNT